MTPRAALLVALGGAAGSLARYALSLALTRPGAPFPSATLAVNALGCLLMGAVMALAVDRPAPPLGEPARLLLAVGFLGGLTTFSTFAYETLALLRAADPARAALNVLLNLSLCLAAVALAWILTRALR